MERLTDKMLTEACNDPWDYCGLDAHCTRHCTQPTPCKIPALVHRLAKIENILGDNYDLDRLRELVEADNDGRCVVLPDGGYEDKDGENALKSAMHTCFYHNNPVTRFIADAVAEKLVRNETKMKHCEGMAKNG